MAVSKTIADLFRTSRPKRRPLFFSANLIVQVEQLLNVFDIFVKRFSSFAWHRIAFFMRQTSVQWCGRPDLNRHEPLGPTDFRTTSAFAAVQEGRLWSGLSLHRGVSALGAARLVSTPSPFGAWFGIANEGFPEFGQFYIGDFPPCTQLLKSVASTISPRPRTS
jgi:hypothetical protein